jgi:hypothetical protein
MDIESMPDSKAAVTKRPRPAHFLTSTAAAAAPGHKWAPIPIGN